MKCSKCTSEMIEGRVHVGGGVPSLFFGGISLGNLTFKAPTWRDHIVQETSDVWPAHYCDKCGAITIETDRRGLSTLEP
jgi:hypothetical protein